MSAILDENRWQPRPGEIAAQIDPRDLKGFWKRDLYVEVGQLLVFSADGRRKLITYADGLRQVPGAGGYVLRDLGDRLAHLFGMRGAERVRALIFDTSAFDVTVPVSGVFTTDPYRVGLTVRLSLRLALDEMAAYTVQRDRELRGEPPSGIDAGLESAEELALLTTLERFETTLMRGRTSVTAADVAAYLRPEIEAELQAWIGARSLNDLVDTIGQRDAFETTLLDRLQQTLDRAGLKFVQLRTLDYALEHQEKLNEIRERYLIRATELDEELRGRETMFDLLTREQLLEIKEDARAVEMYVRRAQVRADMRRAVMDDRFSELRDEDEMERFLRERARTQLLDADEWERFQRTIRWRRDDDLLRREQEVADRAFVRQVEVEDRDRDRAHLLARIDIENRYDVRELELVRRTEIEPAELEHQQNMARQALEGQQALLSIQQTFELAQQRQQEAFELERAERQAAFRREQATLDDMQRQEVALREMTTDLERARNAARMAGEYAKVREIERQQDKADGELGILLLEKMKAVRRRDERERQVMALEAEERRLEMRLKLEKQQFAQTMAREAQQQQYDLARMDKLADLSPSALVTVADSVEKAQLIRDMQQTATMRGMSEQQILALMAKDSPEAAQALAEIARAGQEGRLDSRQRELYERLMQQQSDMTDRMDRIRRDDQLDRAAEREARRQDMETWLSGYADIERAKPPQQPPTVINTGGGTIYPIGGQPGALGGAGGAQALVCPKCATQNATTANFCTNCGHKLRGE